MIFIIQYITNIIAIIENINKGTNRINIIIILENHIIILPKSESQIKENTIAIIKPKKPKRASTIFFFKFS